jgi:hypothetical protein
LMAWVLQKINPNNPLTQFNYSSLQMKEYTPVALMEYLREIVWCGIRRKD